MLYECQIAVYNIAFRFAFGLQMYKKELIQANRVQRQLYPLIMQTKRKTGVF